MIPPLGANGQLPPGRHPATLDEIEQRFVLDPGFSHSVSRADIWQGFLGYLAAWRSGEQDLSVQLLRGLWVGGSFTSNEPDPGDIDVSPAYDAEVLDGVKGQPGVGKVRALIGSRDSVVSAYRVEPFPLPWRAMPSTLFPSRLTPAEQGLLAERGGLDAWWGRMRPPGPKAAPLVPTSFAERGYLEVSL